MSGILLKKLNKYTPEPIKKILRTSIRKKLINNSKFLITTDNIIEFEKKPITERKDIQIQKLKETLVYAFENVKYYNNLFKSINFNPYKFENLSELNKIPYLNKDIILKNENELVSSENIDYYIAYTGGSTGRPLKIYLDTKSIYEERAFVYNYWSKFGYDYKTSRVITFRGLEFKNKIKKYNPLYNEIVLSPFKLNNDTIFDYVKIIDNFGAEFLSGYPSAICNFCSIIKQKNIKLKNRIKAVFLISENCSLEEKKLIEEVLSCKTAEFYGHSERCVFAEEYDNNYFFNEYYGYTEFIATEEENYFKIVCTGFINKKVPFIRYMTDDIAEIKDGIINVIGHRDKEMLIGKNNEKISIASLDCQSNDVFNKIRMYQFEQWKVGKVDLKLVPNDKLVETDLKQVKAALEKKLKGILDINIKVVDVIKLSNRGKAKKVIQRL